MTDYNNAKAMKSALIQAFQNDGNETNFLSDLDTFTVNGSIYRANRVTTNKAPGASENAPYTAQDVSEAQYISIYFENDKGQEVKAEIRADTQSDRNTIYSSSGNIGGDTREIRGGVIQTFKTMVERQQQRFLLTELTGQKLALAEGVTLAPSVASNASLPRLPNNIALG